MSIADKHSESKRFESEATFSTYSNLSLQLIIDFNINNIYTISVLSKLTGVKMAKDKIKKQEKPAIKEDIGPAALCEKLIFWILCATLVIIPIFFNIVSYDQFELPKLTVLRILTSVMLGLWLVKIIIKGRLEWTPTPLDFPLLLWSLLNVLTTFTSLAPHLSFRGEYENFAGSLSNLNYVILYFITAQNIRDKKQVFMLAGSLLLSGLLTGIYSMMQLSGTDIIKWNAESMIKGRYFASMGNPNFLGALLIMMIPVNIAFTLMALKQKKNAIALGLFGLFILLYVSLFGTQSRGPFLGFVVSILVFIVYGLISGYKNIKASLSREQNSGANAAAVFFSRYKKWVAAVLAVLLIGVVLSMTVGKSSAQRLISSITNIQKSLQVSRLHIWIPALKIIKDHPLLGTGVDTFKTVFPKFSGTDFANIDGANVSSRTAHNEPLNVAATMGIPSLGVYLLLLWSYLIMIIKPFRRIEDYDLKILSLGLLSAFVAYFVQNLFSFGVCAINTALYIFMASHFTIYNTYYPAQKKTYVIKPLSGDSVLKSFLYVLAAALTCLLIYKAYSMYAADVSYNRGKIIGSVYNKWDASVAEHTKSVTMEPYEVKYHVYLGLAQERLAATLTDPASQVKAMENSISEYKKGVQLNPGNAYYWGNLGRAYAFLSQLKNSREDFETAIKYYTTAIDRAPVTGLFYNNLIELYTRSGMIENAVPLLAKLETLDKKIAAGAYFMMGNFFFGSKDFTNAEKAYLRTLELNPQIFQAYHNLGVVYAATRKKQEAISYLRRFIDMSPDSEMVPNAEKILKELH